MGMSVSLLLVYVCVFNKIFQRVFYTIRTERYTDLAMQYVMRKKCDFDAKGRRFSAPLKLFRQKYYTFGFYTIQAYYKKKTKFQCAYVCMARVNYAFKYKMKKTYHSILQFE